MAYKVHVVSKKDISNHAVLDIDKELPALAASSVRVRTKLITMTKNNLGYAMTAHFLPWWDAFPVTPNLPAPYNDTAEWGIVPAWGYSQVIESNVEGLSKDTILWGYWPTSTLPFDLKLRRDDVPGYYWEISEHRKRLFSLYNHIEVVKDVPPKETQGQIASFYIFFVAGYLLERYCFPGRDSPYLSAPLGGPGWTAEDSKLSDTVVINLCASSKTALAFSWALRRHVGSEMPLALVEVCSSPDSLPSHPWPPAFETKRIPYSQLSEPATLEWISRFKPSRVLVVDSGAPDGILNEFEDAFFASGAEQTFLNINVGGSLGVQLKNGRSQRHTYNTGGVKYYVHDIEGMSEVNSALKSGFRECMDAKAFGEMEVLWRGGVDGDDGIEGAWNQLCDGSFPRGCSLLYELCP